MSDYLPLEAILEILLRLPVKSLLKCRSVCKTWKNLIENPSFINTHLQTSLSTPNTPLLLLRLIKHGTEQYFLHFDNNEFHQFKQLHFPFRCSYHYFEIVGSCNGLVCLLGGFDKLLLWNPSIQKYMALPDPCPNPSHAYSLFLGFGYDSNTNDFIVVRILAAINFIDVHLFSLNGISWKKIAAFSPTYKIEGNYISAFANGAVHWLATQKGENGGIKNVVLAFDISLEKFFVIELPEIFVGSCPMELSILKYGESSIAMLKNNCEDGEQFDIWVMKEYGVVGSWTTVLHLHDQSVEEIILKIFGFRNNNGKVLLEVKDGEIASLDLNFQHLAIDGESGYSSVGKVLLEVNGGEVVSLDLNSQQIQYHGIDGAPGYWLVDTYIESLAMLDKGVDTRNMTMQVI